ncbi:MAG: 50S ribosomal protein L23 [Kiritimatiellae bacterium]|nr:50S ribosomal protein L23 [Kiritimatiellia bacterium]
MKEAETLIQHLQLTEKSTRLTEAENKYFFKVDRNTNKMEIKKAVEDLFGVKVVKVNTVHRQGKKKRDRKMRYGFKPSWKRAVVTLKEGESIDYT